MRIESQYNIGPNPLLTKIFDIGPWNMVLTDNVTIAHGLTYTSIRMVYANIINNARVSISPLEFTDDYLTDDGKLVWSPSYVYLYRRIGGYFDSVFYDDGVMNRGYVMIQYI